MSIHDQAEAAARAVYDVELARLRDETAAAKATAANLEALAARISQERDQAQLDLVVAREELGASSALVGQLRGRIAELDDVVAQLRERVRELEQGAGLKPIVVGAGPLGSAAFGIPESNVIYLHPQGDDKAAGTERAPKRTITGGIIAAGTSTTLLFDGGAYAGNFRQTRPDLRMQGLPGKEVWIDGGGTQQVAGILKAKTAMRSLGLRRFNVTDDSKFERGLVIPSGADGSVIEQARFEDFGSNIYLDPKVTKRGAGAVDISYNADVTLREVTFARSGIYHVYTNRTERLVIDRVLFQDNNLLGHPPQPLAAAVKHCRARGPVIKHSIARGVNGAQAFWLDVSCYEFAIFGNDLDAGYEGILLELSGKGFTVSNRVTVGPTARYGIRSLSTNDALVGWNEISGGSPNIQLLIEEDERVNTAELYRAEGVTWETTSNEVIGNVLSGDFKFGQVGVYDNTAADRGGPRRVAKDMIKKIAGNQYGARADGRTRFFQWSETARAKFEGRTEDQLIAAYPSIVQRENVPMRDDVAKALGVSATEHIGVVTPKLVPAT